MTSSSLSWSFTPLSHSQWYEVAARHAKEVGRGGGAGTFRCWKTYLVSFRCL
jgi:hypothetical protein